MDAYSAFLHTDAWETLQKASGLEIQKNDGSLYIKRQIPKGCYWQSSRCDIPENWNVPAFARDAWFLRLEPATDLDYQHLEQFRLVPTVAFQPRQTSIVDISRSEGDILASLKQKHRYNIKVAEKHAVKIELHHENIGAQTPRFMQLLHQTADRHDFHTHSEKYYQQMIETLEPEKMAHLAIATYNGTDVAAALIITCGNVATYLHGASTYAHREVMAPYLMHWEVMKFAKSIDCTAYDLWGTHAVQKDGEWVSQEGHASAGTTRFKLGFNGTIINYPGTFDLVLKPIQYRIYTVIRALRSKKRAFT